MPAVFCLRLAWGLIASLLILPRPQVHPRFYRVQYLIALGLVAVAGYFLIEEMNVWLGTALAASLFCCFAGSIVWHLEGVPLATPTLCFTVASLTMAMFIASCAVDNETSDFWQMRANDISAAALLGSAMSAMLMGHSYLLTPTMSLTPLMRLLGVMMVSLMLRVLLGAMGLYELKAQSAPLTLESIVWLFLRWLFGFGMVLILGWMAWETSRIRSTQSATGILYVVVIFCFLGEAISQFLVVKTGSIL